MGEVDCGMCRKWANRRSETEQAERGAGRFRIRPCSEGSRYTRRQMIGCARRMKRFYRPLLQRIHEGASHVTNTVTRNWDGRTETMAKRILTPIDGSEESTAIVPTVAALARGGGSTVRLLKVFPVPEHVVTPDGRTV